MELQADTFKGTSDFICTVYYGKLQQQNIMESFH